MRERQQAVARFRETVLPATSYEGLSREVCARLRSLAAAQIFTLFDLAPRGRYWTSGATVDAALAQELHDLVAACAGGPVRRVAERWTRMSRGDYALCLDDERWLAALPKGELYELTLDASEGACGEGEVIYTHRGQAYFSVAQVPGQLAVVARGPTVARYDRYLTHRVGQAQVLRWRAVYVRA